MRIDKNSLDNEVRVEQLTMNVLNIWFMLSYNEAIAIINRI